MTATSLVRRSLLKALRTKIIPQAKADGISRLMLVEPPFITPPDVTLRPHPGSPLRETSSGRAYSYISRWDEQWLNAVRFPLLCFVLEGEADMRIGMTESMAACLRDEHHAYWGLACDYQILSFPEGGFFLVPPGVPYSRAGVHWERPHPEQAYSRIFWLQILPTGAFCHICSTEKMVHTSEPNLFIGDARLSNIIEFLIDEMQKRSPHFEQIVQLQLNTLLLCVERALASESNLLNTDIVSRAASSEADPTNTAHFDTIRRACSYIEAHLQEPLSLAAIASHSYVSPSHLNRAFRADKGVSVMKFLMQRRIEMARTLLAGSDLPIREIGRMVGLAHPPHFTKAFSDHNEMSPLEYRKRNRP